MRGILQPRNLPQKVMTATRLSDSRPLNKRISAPVGIRGPEGIPSKMAGSIAKVRLRREYLLTPHVSKLFHPHTGPSLWSILRSDIQSV
jgi:hypothetical protein